MPYRNETPETLRSRIEDLEQRLAETRRELQDAFDEIAWLRETRGRAIMILQTAAAGTAPKSALEELRRRRRSP